MQLLTKDGNKAAGDQQIFSIVHDCQHPVIDVRTDAGQMEDIQKTGPADPNKGSMAQFLLQFPKGLPAGIGGLAAVDKGGSIHSFQIQDRVQGQLVGSRILSDLQGKGISADHFHQAVKARIQVRAVDDDLCI